jgi:hypothetical protein
MGRRATLSVYKNISTEYAAGKLRNWNIPLTRCQAYSVTEQVSPEQRFPNILGAPSPWFRKLIPDAAGRTL